MKAISWNMARNSVGRAKRVHDEAWEYFAAADLDLAFLQEVTVPTWASDRWTVVAPPVRFWGSALLARPALDLQPLETPRTSLLDRDGFLAWGVLPGFGDTELILGSIPAPVGRASADDLDGRDPASIARPSHRGRAAGPYRTDAAFAITRDLVTGSRFLVSGDWNVSRLWDEIRGITECHEFFERAEAAGWREVTRGAPEHRTWYRNAEPAYQLDHAFSDPDTARRFRSVTVDPRPAASARVSDHAPLFLTLDPDAPADDGRA